MSQVRILAVATLYQFVATTKMSWMFVPGGSEWGDVNVSTGLWSRFFFANTNKIAAHNTHTSTHSRDCFLMVVLGTFAGSAFVLYRLNKLRKKWNVQLSRNPKWCVMWIDSYNDIGFVEHTFRPIKFTANGKPTRRKQYSVIILFQLEKGKFDELEQCCLSWKLEHQQLHDSFEVSLLCNLVTRNDLQLF